MPYKDELNLYFKGRGVKSLILSPLVIALSWFIFVYYFYSKKIYIFVVIWEKEVFKHSLLR